MKKHPHTCGEDPAFVSSTASCRETPPRVWGRHPQRYPAADDGRNTPTHVGKTFSQSHCNSGRWKHPHACGEDFSTPTISFSHLETPPRMWGRRQNLAYRYLGFGNTPTHVGKTCVTPNVPVTARKHPHACGEDKTSSSSVSMSTETPPRMWGRLAVNRSHQANVGNTPTHVGKTPAYCV